MWSKKAGTKKVSEKSGAAAGLAAAGAFRSLRSQAVLARSRMDYSGSLLALAGVFALALSACQQPTASDLNAVTGTSGVTSTTTIVPASTKAGAPDIISIVSGNAQTAINGSQLSNQLTVRVTDASGNAVPGVLVTFASGTGGGIIQTSATVFSDVSGLASATVILGSQVGTQTFTASMSSGTVSTVTFTEISTAVASVVKIYPLVGTTSVGTTSILIGDTFTLRAVLVSTSGAFIKEIPATWWMTGSLTTANLAITGGNPSKYATLSPTATGTGTINALVDDLTLIGDNNITSTTTVTGTITVSLALTPDSISIVSGNSQTGQVGTNLAQNLVVKVVNAGGTPVPGVDVTFAVASGGGQIVSAQPVATDVNGLATCIVKLGGVVGTGHSYTATMATGSSKQVLFSGTATHGPAAQLSFYQQPGGANSGTAFATQPVVEVRDQYGNRVTSDSSSTVTLSVNTGTGSLSGALTATVSSGLAAFTNVSYSVGENGVKLAASSSIGGVSSATSGAFDVGTIIAAAQCVVEGNGWQTIDGGCKDLTSGLVWSASSFTTGAGTRTWHQAVWNSASSGSPSPELWQVARGITKDEEGSGNYDSNSAAYCQTLEESGMTDWRLPTYSEISSALTDGSGSALKDAGQCTWVSTPSSSTIGYLRFLNSTALCTGGGVAFTSTSYTRCVREPAPTKILVVNQPAAATKGFGVNVPFETQPKFRVADSTNSTTFWSTVPVTLTVTAGTGQLCLFSPLTGVTSACASSQTVSAVAGVVTFTNLSYNKAESGVIFTASSPGLTSVTTTPITINQTYPYAACKLVGGYFINGLGGCKDVTTGVIFSAPSPAAMSWHSAIWDSTVSGASPQDADDNGRVNEYYPFAPYLPLTSPDNLGAAYCHDLKESGQTDWVFPIQGEPYNLGTKSPATYLNASTSTLFWSGYTANGTPTSALLYSFAGGSGSDAKTTTYYVVCIRSDAPAKLKFQTLPNADSNGWGAGVLWTTQPVVDIVDADGAGPMRFMNAAFLGSGNPTVTLSVIPASDGTGGTGKIQQFGTGVESTKVLSEATSVSVSAGGGRATFSSLGYSKPGEKFRLRASATILWKGQSITLETADTPDITVPQTYPYAACKLEGGYFVNGLGGCKDITTGVIYSAPSLASMTWHAALWDSTVPGASAPDADDNGRANEYYPNAPYTPGTSPDITSTAYCHDLKESGLTDWVLPIAGEPATLLGKNASTYFNSSTSTWFWSGYTIGGTPTLSYIYNLGGGSSSDTKTSSERTICIRSEAPAKLKFQTAPADSNGFGAGVVWSTQPVVDILDANDAGPLRMVGSLYLGAGSPVVTLSVIAASDGTGGTGNLILYNGTNVVAPGETSGGITLAADSKSVSMSVWVGRVTFANLAYSKPDEKFRLRATATVTWKGQSITLTSATTGDITIPAIYALSQCNSQTNWTSQYGGCRDTLTGGLVWSHALGNFSWYTAVWDSAFVNSEAVDADDGARTNDYDLTNPPGTGADNSIVDACHRLILNGYTDWRMPTYAEIDLALRASTRQGYTALNWTGANSYLWSSSTVQATPANAYLFNRVSGIWDGSNPKTVGYGARCVRPATP